MQMQTNQSFNSSTFRPADSDITQKSRPTSQEHFSFERSYPPTLPPGLDDDSAGPAPTPNYVRWISLLDAKFTSHFPVLHTKGSRFYKYLRGPQPPVDLSDPVPLLDRDYSVLHRHFILRIESTFMRVTGYATHPILLIILAAAYIISFAFFARAQWYMSPDYTFIDCTSVYWLEDAGCGLNGEICAPFANQSFSFRCPAQCASVILQNPRTIGNEEIDWVPLLVGGGDANGTYRGDSFICASALQAGLFSDSKGGCATLELTGNYTNYLPLIQNGFTSIGFPSVFPLSFQFVPGSAETTNCKDLRNPALAFNVLVTVFLTLVLRPKPIVLYWCLVCIGFWHITLFSEPQSTPPPLDDAFGTFLPTLFIAYAFWKLAFKFTLPVFVRTAPIEGTIWYLGPFWVGVLTNLTFSEIPIERLTASDIRARSGGITALVIIIIVLFFLVLNQIRVIRKTGWLLYYVGWYIAGGLCALVLALLPGLVFRLHHYIIAMALIPGTAWPTRLSAIYQGLLLGLFLNGAAAWGLASILQTSEDLVGDGTLGTAIPTFLTNSTTFNSSIPLINQTVSWAPLPDNSTYDGFALLVDDVERYVGVSLNFTLASLQEGIPHFFRLAFTDQGNIADFTKPATLWPNGTWVDPTLGET